MREADRSENLRLIEELARFKDLYARASADRDKANRLNHSLRMAIQMPELYLDSDLRIVAFSGDFLFLDPRVGKLASREASLSEFLKQKDFQKVKTCLGQIESLESLPYDSGNPWTLRYHGPASSGELGQLWHSSRIVNKNNWSIVDRNGTWWLHHSPHVEDECDCFLMSTQEFGGPDEDVRLTCRIRTPEDASLIRDLSVVISGSPADTLSVPDSVGYTACAGSNGNTEFRLQRRTVNQVSLPSSLRTGYEYDVLAERTGGRLWLKVSEAGSGKVVADLKFIDHEALYDRYNHVGFTTFSAEAEFGDVRIFTRQSAFRLAQFRVRLDCRTELEGPHGERKYYNLNLRSDRQLSRHILTFEDVTALAESHRQLSHEREQLLSVFDSINGDIYVSDFDTYEILYVNRHLRETLGRDPVGLKCYSELRGFSRPCDFCPNETVRKLDGETYKWEHFNDRLRRHYMITNRMIQWTDGRNVRFELAIDVSQWKETERSLRESETKYRTLFERTLNPIMVIDADGNYVDCNSATEKFLETSREKLLRMSIYDFSFPDQHSEIKAVHKPLWTSGGVVETRYLVNGREKILDLSVTPAPWGGEIVVFGVGRDITDKKTAEKALAAEKDRLAVTLASIGEAVISTDRKGRISLINEVAASLVGFGSEQAIGQPLSSVFKIINEKTRRKIADPSKTTLRESHINGSVEGAILVSASGEEHPISYSGAPILDRDGGKIGVVLVFRDVSAARKIDEELQRTDRLESLGTLAGGIAHDFNNILTSVVGYISLAGLKSRENADVNRLLAEAEKACLRAGELTRQLLTFSRGGTPIKSARPLEGLIREAVEFALHGASVAADFKIVKNLWLAEIDEKQISQVLHNLVINAVQAMPQGGRLSVMAENIEIEDLDSRNPRPGDYIRITVTDEGGGIPEKIMAHIFDPYFTTKTKGSGLGLSTCYSIVRRHDGHIEVKSRLGEGSDFMVYLPARRGIPLSVELAESGSGSMAGAWQGCSALIMDDEEMVRGVAREMLEFLGFRTYVTGDGEKACRAFQTAHDKGNPFDLVLLDLTVPGGMGGAETVKRMLKIDPGVRAMVTSGYSEEPVLSDFSAFGFSGIVLKPYKLEQMYSAISRTLTPGSPRI